MEKLTNQLLKTLNQNRLFSLCFCLTLLYFIYKGVLYAMIGSFVPLLIILTILGLISFSLQKSPRAFKKSLELWSSLIILWSTVRLLLSTINEFVKPIPEGHIDGQLGLISVLVSLAFLFSGIYIWNKRKGIMAEIEAIHRQKF